MSASTTQCSFFSVKQLWLSSGHAGLSWPSVKEVFITATWNGMAGTDPSWS